MKLESENYFIPENKKRNFDKKKVLFTWTCQEELAFSSQGMPGWQNPVWRAACRPGIGQYLYPTALLVAVCRARDDDRGVKYSILKRARRGKEKGS